MRVHGFVWLLLVLAVTLLTPVFVSKDSYKEIIQSEFTESLHWYGSDDGTALVRRANARYLKLMAASHMDDAIEWIDKGLSKLPKRRNGKTLGFFDLPEGSARQLMQGPVYFLYLGVWRFENYMLWLLYVAPFILALLWDGIMRRKTYQTLEHYSSPSQYNILWHLIIAVVALALMTISVAIPFPALGYPFALVGIGAILRSMVANLQASA
ncbi:MAG: DUF4400 domain-containing protein [Sulfuritalea sp.]|nr:DUF4400 domain-containing protein [Sulfuritalea sp.]